MIEEATQHQAATWLSDVTADSVRRAMRLCWINVSIGSPDIVTHEAREKLVSKVYKENSALLHIDTKCVPIESPSSMSYVDREQTPTRHPYNIVTSEAPDLMPKPHCKSR